ncbi:MAG: PEP/pyruvate-binding domain-containing protein [Desulfonatronovibrio sp.]
MKNLLNTWKRDSGRSRCSYLVNKDSEHSRKYKLFKSFLEENYTALHEMSRLEEMHYGEEETSQGDIRKRTDDLLEAVRKMIRAMRELSGKYKKFDEIWPEIETDILDSLHSRQEFKSDDLVLSYDSISSDMAWFVGGKAMNLAALRNEAEIPAPDGFAVTAGAYQKFLDENGLETEIQQNLKNLNIDSYSAVESTCGSIREKFNKAHLPRKIEENILKAMSGLEEKYGKDLLVAVRSSAAGEDGEISFAGQYSSFINIPSTQVLKAYKKVLASKYNPGALVYRKKNGLSEEDTPMCVAVTIMVKARSSGVMYTADPASGDPSAIRISAGFGFGERIVSGEDAGDDYQIRKDDLRIIHKNIVKKEKMLFEDKNHKPELMDVPEDKQKKQVLGDWELKSLARYGLSLEKYFKTSQDIEWVKDQDDQIFIIQSRALAISREKEKEALDEKAFIEEHPLIISGGISASGGRWTGPVFKAETYKDIDPPNDCVLVTRTASPGYAAYLSGIGAIITDMGSVTSHLASVAREYGVPALFNVKEAFSSLENGQEISLDAAARKIYQGRVQEFSESRNARSPVAPTGASRKLKIILEKISPLNLTDPDSEEFVPENCSTVHDVIRFLHERIMTEMFNPSGDDNGGEYGVLKGGLPIDLRVMDLGRGLAQGLTTCDTLKPEHIRSVPMEALWRGLSHPGITWSGTIDFNLANLGRLMTTPEAESLKAADTTSYALLARDYMNLSIKFGYHYANIEALCTDKVSQNLINFQFSGGAGGYLGRSLRIVFLAEVMAKLEFETDIQGDFLGASLKGFDCDLIQDKLDHLGRLLACSRLLDMVLRSEDDVGRFVRKFMREDYDFLSGTDVPDLRDFHVLEGYWYRKDDHSGNIGVQDGKKTVDPVSRKIACLMDKVSGDTYRSFLDRVKAYHYYPLAIAKEGYMENGQVQVRVKCVEGCIDMTAGLVIGLKNKGDYLVFRIDALKRKASLWHIKNSNPVRVWAADLKILPDQWYLLEAEVKGKSLKLSVDGQNTLTHESDEEISGHVGLASKADSVAHFADFTAAIHGEKRVFRF